MHSIDAILIAFYRVFPVPIAGYLFGTFCLAMICVVVGQISQALIWEWNRKWLYDDNREMVRMHNLSLKALAAGDKTVYKASNKVANDAFGKFFFARMAIGMASLWPVPFALAWMDSRFSGVEFLMFGGFKIGYLATFIPLLVLSAILFSTIKSHIPVFSRMVRHMREDSEAIGRPMRLRDLASGAPTETDRTGVGHET